MYKDLLETKFEEKHCFYYKIKGEFSAVIYKFSANPEPNNFF